MHIYIYIHIFIYIHTYTQIYDKVRERFSFTSSVLTEDCVRDFLHTYILLQYHMVCYSIYIYIQVIHIRNHFGSR